MLGIERRRKIMDKLNEERKVYVSELAKLFGVTEETIRRDLEKLEGKDLLRRSYGGAVLNEHTNDDISFVKRSTILSENKQAIATRAARLVSDGDTIMVDASTTCLALIGELQRKKGITIITNSVRLVHDYLSGPFHLISTGGVVRSNSCALVGDVALTTLQRYNVDLALVSCKSLDRERGIMESNDAESTIKVCMASRAKRVVLLADHTKFGNTAFVHALDFEQIDALVTDDPVSTTWRNFLEKKQIELID
ncbi:DeoR/GlpR family DNA-binding transcription regulator [uncultured Selenomonas sp.]|uniref:DeoR/GlpR family DNA-binding transcription regulator n=1 Tax=uncultured Selenomonas sp. TaxID=159275 RepID=UPI0025EB361B|nr:DeoR/GlpR family DNA-binding transcription regulator [uncultured Selenomonas sp.]